jgi:hypothetical protein
VTGDDPSDNGPNELPTDDPDPIEEEIREINRLMLEAQREAKGKLNPFNVKSTSGLIINVTPVQLSLQIGTDAPGNNHYDEARHTLHTMSLLQREMIERLPKHIVANIMEVR